MLRAKRPVTSLFSLLCLGLVLAACRDAVQSVPESLAEDATVAFGADLSRRGFRTIDDQFAALTHDVPGFGGLFYDSVGRLTVYLKRPETLPGARPQIERFLASVSSRNPARLAEIPEHVASARALPARYDFAELYNWYLGHIIPVIGPLDEVTMTDIDDRTNRITVGVRDAGARAQVEEALRRLGLPSDAVTVIEFPGIRILLPASGNSARPSLGPTVSPSPNAISLADLTGQIRPVPGGALIQVRFSNGARFSCTLAYNLIFQDSFSGAADPYGYFLTNSHCTEEFGAVTGISMGQPDMEHVIGTEVVDPPLRSWADDNLCPPGRACRSSDAAVFRYNWYADSDHPWVAFPPVGSTTFSDFRKVRLRDDAIVGETVHKIGSATGHTTGRVTRSCFNADQLTPDGQYDTGRTMLCQQLADFPTPREGDSGSPVVMENNDFSLADVGILWGPGVFSKSIAYWTEFAKTCEGYFCGGYFFSSGPSNPNVRTTALTVTVDGPNTAPEFSSVTVTVVEVSNGNPPLAYAWTVDGSPTCGNSDSCAGPIGAGGTTTTFAVTVTDVDGDTGGDSHGVWAEYSGCPECAKPRVRVPAITREPPETSSVRLGAPQQRGRRQSWK